MSDFPQPQILPLHIHTISSQFSGGAEAQYLVGTANFTTYNWPAQNRAIFIPMTLPWPYPVQRVFWCNGSTATGNMCFAIYSPAGRRIYTSGSVAQSGATQLQYAAVATPFLLSPGTYYFALANDSATTTNRIFGASTVATPEGRLAGMVQQNSAFPLPETATFEAWSSTGAPLYGVTRTASGF